MASEANNLSRTILEMQALGTLGVDAAWDTALKEYVAAQVRVRFQEDWGEIAQREEIRKAAEYELKNRHGRIYRDTGEFRQIMKARVADEQLIDDGYYQPLWAAQRRLATTPAPNLQAAVFKAFVLGDDEIYNDAEVGDICATALEADLARFAA